MKKDRICPACDSTETMIDKHNYEHWHKHDNDWLCHKCYMKYVMNPIHSPKWSAIRNPLNAPRRFNYKGKLAYLPKTPRKGICSQCGAVRGIDCKRTSLHHQEYDDNDILAHTIELCNSCHTKHHRSLNKS